LLLEYYPRKKDTCNAGDENKEAMKINNKRTTLLNNILFINQLKVNVEIKLVKEKANISKTD
jgi:hypothetical protein